MFDRFTKPLIVVLGVALCLFTLGAVNYSVLQPQSERAIFVMLGMVLCFLAFPAAEALKEDDKRGVWNGLKSWFSTGRLKLPAPLAGAARLFDFLLVAGVVICFGYLFVQTEPWEIFKGFWSGGKSLGDRAGDETTFDIAIGLVGLILVLETTRRSIGWIVPMLAIVFLLHAFFAASLPDWLFPHPGKNPTQLISATFIQSLGVLGPAAGVMFKYVFLFVVFGAFLEMSGATQFIIDFSERIFGNSPGGPAKVAVLGSGLMGSLSGSAVANAVTTGSFTIPMMRNSGFQPHIAGGITAAAASGGALVPPVMGAGAYMMLEFVKREPGQPEVTFLEIAKSALIPAALYYLSIGLIVHFYSKRLGAKVDEGKPQKKKLPVFEGIVFFGALTVLIGLLLLKFSAFKAVTGALVLILLLSAVRPKLKLDYNARVLAIVSFSVVFVVHQLFTWLHISVPDWYNPFLAPSWFHPTDGHLMLKQVFDSLLSSSVAGMFGLLLFGLTHPTWRPEVSAAFAKSAKNGISLVAASACVGIIIGVVQTTPIANDFGEAIKGVVETNLLLALLGIMTCSLVLGMGVPSVVCYLLMATLMGSLLKQMGVDPLAAHLFIFYFGMMSMVTPPVALAAYASASIAGAKIMPTAMAAFRFSLVGFALPFMFIYRPELLLMGKEATTLTSGDIPAVLFVALVCIAGVVALSAGVTGYLKNVLPFWSRALLFVAAILLVMPNLTLGNKADPLVIPAMFINFAGGALFAVLIVHNWIYGKPPTKGEEPPLPSLPLEGGLAHGGGDGGE